MVITEKQIKYSSHEAKAIIHKPAIFPFFLHIYYFSDIFIYACSTGSFQASRCSQDSIPSVQNILAPPTTC